MVILRKKNFMKLITKFFLLLVACTTMVTMPLEAVNKPKKQRSLSLKQRALLAHSPSADEELALKFVSSPLSEIDKSKNLSKAKQSKDFIKDIRVNLEQANQQAAKRIADAINTKNDVYTAHAIGTITDTEKTQKIIELDDIIATTKQELLHLTETALDIADETEQQASYVNTFVSGMRSFGSRAMATVKNVYYNSSEQERLLAQAVITELENLKNSKTDSKVIKQIDDEIYKQKLISGDEMSTQKKLLIGAALTAATIAGVALTSRYLSSSNTPAEEIAPLEPAPDISDKTPPQVPSAVSPVTTQAPQPDIGQLERELEDKKRQRVIVKKEYEQATSAWSQLYRLKKEKAQACDQQHSDLVHAVNSLESCLASYPSFFGSIERHSDGTISMESSRLGRYICKSQLEEYQQALKAWQTSNERLQFLDFKQRRKTLHNEMKNLWIEQQKLKSDITVLEYEIGIAIKRRFYNQFLHN